MKCFNSNIYPMCTVLLSTGYAWDQANCYGYPVGKNDWLISGGGNLWNTGTVVTLYNFVKKDFKDGKFKRNDGKSGKAKIRLIDAKTSEIKKDEYRIAMRVSRVEANGREDFHFWKQNPNNGKWYNKHGSNKVQALGKDTGTKASGNPDNIYSKGWRRIENYYGEGLHLRYDELIKYAAIKGIKFKK